MRRIITAAILALACTTTVQAQSLNRTAEVSSARKHRIYYRVMRRPKPSVAEPELRRVRIIPIYCSDQASQFSELWCHRVERAIP